MKRKAPGSRVTASAALPRRAPEEPARPERGTLDQGDWFSRVPRVQMLLSAGRPVELAPLTQPPVAVTSHIHGPIEVGVLLTGEQRRLFEGCSFRALPGDVWMIPMWEPHGWETPYEHTERVVIHFLPDLLGGEMIGDTSWLSAFAVAPQLRPRVSGRQMREQVVAIGRELWTEAHEQRYGWVTAVRANVLRLLVVLYRSWHRPETGRVAPRVRAISLARVMPVVTAVQERPGRPITVAEAAGLCGLSRRQFHRVFSQTMGVGFQQFRLRARLGHAERLLAATDLPVDTVAADSGFVDRAHLYRHFVRYYGCGPAAFRRRAREG